jgi:hypothetical protein
VRGALVVGRPVVGHRCETRAAPDSLSESRTGRESFANVSMHGGLAFSVAAASIFGGRHVGLGIPQAKRLLCRFHLHHKWVRRFNPEGEDYLQCNACGKDLYDVGRAGLLAFNSLAGHRKARAYCASRCMSCSNMSSIQLPDGTVVEVPPERCPAGHPLRSRGTLVGWSPYDCTGGGGCWPRSGISQPPVNREGCLVGAVSR